MSHAESHCGNAAAGIGIGMPTALGEAELLGLERLVGLMGKADLAVRDARALKLQPLPACRA